MDTQLAQESDQSEGFFLNGSSYAVLSKGLLLEPGSLVGFSFRTCLPGELLRQISGESNQLTLKLDEQGRLVLTLVSEDARSEAVVEAGLLDARWHTVLLSVDQETNDLTVNVSNGGGSVVLNAPVIRQLHLQSTQVRVGAGMVACIREGPGVRFSNNGLSSFSAVHWLSPGQICVLPDTCSGEKTGAWTLKFHVFNVLNYPLHPSRLI